MQHHGMQYHARDCCHISRGLGVQGFGIFPIQKRKKHQWQQRSHACRSAKTFLRVVVPRKTTTIRPGPHPTSATVSHSRSHIISRSSSLYRPSAKSSESSFAAAAATLPLIFGCRSEWHSGHTVRFVNPCTARDAVFLKWNCWINFDHCDSLQQHGAEYLKGCQSTGAVHLQDAAIECCLYESCPM